MVPVVDLSRRGQRFASTFARAAERIAASGSFLLGAELTAFEAEFAAVARRAALRRRVVGRRRSPAGARRGRRRPRRRGDRAGVHRRAHGIGRCRGRRDPVCVDVDPTTACITTEGRSRRARRARTRVIVVHLYGYPADLPDTDLPIIEDAAQAHGALHDPGRSAATAYSFYPTKNLGGIGDGGAVVTDDAALADTGAHAARARHDASSTCTSDVSQNFRMSEIEAAWLRLGLAELDRRHRPRAAIAARYRQAAPAPALAGRRIPDHAYHLAVFRSRRPRPVARRARERRRRHRRPLPVGAHPAAGVSRPRTMPRARGRGLGRRVHQRAVLPGDDRRRDRAVSCAALAEAARR